MKIKNILMGAVALTLSGSAFGATTVDITGATAFRAATLDAINAEFVASAANFKVQHDQTASTIFNGATRSIWEGTFGGVADVTIRTSFNGSVEGIRAVVTTTANPTYYVPGPSDTFTTTARTAGGLPMLFNDGAGPITNPPVAAAESEVAFSDVSIASTPFPADPLIDINDIPADNPVGVVVFTMLTNEGASSSLTNITSQGFRALMSAGVVNQQLLTGNSTDSPTRRIFATGRNDGSGTRTAYLAETGYGISNPVNQYVTLGSTATAITLIQLVPITGVNDSDPITPGVQPYPGQLTANASTVWGNAVAGNGGYSSGSTLRTDMGKTMAAVQVRNANYGVQFASIDCGFVTWLSLNDALTARTNGAKVLGYDGSTLSGFQAGASELTVDDKFKVTTGDYAAWSYQQMFPRVRGGGLNTDQQAVFDALFAAVPGNLATAGIPLGDMVNSRSGSDGSTIAP